MDSDDTLSTGIVYEEGIKLSRNYSSRTESQSNELYKLIQDAAIEAQNPQSRESDKALEFLTFAFTPLVKKTASKIYPHLVRFAEYDDVLQETYSLFITLVYSYNPSIASFPYYIQKMLPQQVRAWSQKARKKFSASIDFVVIDNLIADPLLDGKDAVYARYHTSILAQEYEDFILSRAEKKAKSVTVKEVCYNYFLGKETCVQISERLGISYHAVYEVIKRLEKEIRRFLEEESLAGLYQGE